MLKSNRMNFSEASRELTKKISLYPWTNVATVLFGALCLGDWIFSFNLAGEKDVVLNLAVAFVFMNSLHVLFPFWMMQRSGDFRQLLELNVGQRGRVQSGLAVIFLFLFSAVLTIHFLMGPWAAVAFNLFFVIWSTWHYLSQTRGLYTATFLNEGRPTDYGLELRLLKLMVIFLFLARALRLYNITYPGDFLISLLRLGTLAYVASALLLLALFVRLWTNLRTNRKTQGWILTRFLFWLGTAVTPASAYAVTAVHGSEYLDLTRRVERKSTQMTRSQNVKAVFLLALIGFLVLDTLYLSHSLSKWPAVQTAVMSFGFSLSMTHYVLDTYLYRTKNAEARTIMRRFAEADSENSSQNSLLLRS